METSSQEVVFGALLVLVSVPLVCAVLAVVGLRRGHARTVGEPLARQRASRTWLRVAWTVHAAALAAIVVNWESLPSIAALTLLALGSLLLALSPLAHDADIGERGVRHGWMARALADLEEWRLTGEHLRWKLGGEWVACRIAPEHHTALRERLRQACAERESPFKD